MSQAALDGLEEAGDLDVAGWEFHTDDLVVFFHGRVCLSIGLVVDEASDFLGQAVAGIAELFVVAVHLKGVVAVGALAGVHLEVISRPALRGVDWARDRDDGVLGKAHHALLLGGGRLGVDDGRHVGADGRHSGYEWGVLQNGLGSGSRCDVIAKWVWNGSDEATPPMRVTLADVLCFLVLTTRGSNRKADERWVGLVLDSRTGTAMVGEGAMEYMYARYGGRKEPGCGWMPELMLGVQGSAPISRATGAGD